jgi:hypothetical protein
MADAFTKIGIGAAAGGGDLMYFYGNAERLRQIGVGPLGPTTAAGGAEPGRGPQASPDLHLRGQPQVQIWDSDRTPGARGKDKGSGSGALWNNPEDKGKRPLKKADKPVGEWNTLPHHRQGRQGDGLS